MKPWFGPEETEAVAETLASGWVAQGPQGKAFEAEFAERLAGSAADAGACYAAAVSSATTGLHLALAVLGVGPGDEVIVPSLSFIATANSVRYTGAAPVFADVDFATQNVTAETIAAVITPATRVVMLVHQGGIPADLDAIRALCASRDLQLVEDAACAIGATHRGSLIGADSDLAVFSFHPRKVITTGEGGMVVSRDPDLLARIRRLREHGMSVSAADRHLAKGPVIEQYLEVGFNYRMSDIQAAVGRVQLRRLDDIVARRRHLASIYQERLSRLPGVVTAGDPAYGTTNFQSFWMTLPDDFPVARDSLMAALADRGVSTRRGFMAAHLEPAYEGTVHAPLPVTEIVTAKSLILPLFHAMTDHEAEFVATAILDLAATPAPV